VSRHPTLEKKVEGGWGGGGGGGGLRLKPARKSQFLETNKNNEYVVQNAQSLRQNNVVSARKLAFTYNNLITKFQGVFSNVHFSLQKGDV